MWVSCLLMALVLTTWLAAVRVLLQLLRFPAITVDGHEVYLLMARIQNAFSPVAFALFAFVLVLFDVEISPATFVGLTLGIAVASGTALAIVIVIGIAETRTGGVLSGTTQEAKGE